MTRMDASAVDRSLEPFEIMIEGLARRMGRWYAPVEDLRQEGRLGALKAVRSYNESFRCSLATWVYHCARGAMLHYRRSQARLSGVGRCVSGEEAVGPDFTPAVVTRIWLRGLLAELSPRHRAALLLLYVARYTHAEAGAVLGVRGGRQALAGRALGALRRRTVLSESPRDTGPFRGTRITRI